MRVYELAKEAGVTSADVLRAAESCGAEVTSAISSIDAGDLASLKEAVAGLSKSADVESVRAAKRAKAGEMRKKAVDSDRDRLSAHLATAKAAAEGKIVRLAPLAPAEPVEVNDVKKEVAKEEPKANIVDSPNPAEPVKVAPAAPKISVSAAPQKPVIRMAPGVKPKISVNPVKAPKVVTKVGLSAAGFKPLQHATPAPAVKITVAAQPKARPPKPVNVDYDDDDSRSSRKDKKGRDAQRAFDKRVPRVAAPAPQPGGRISVNEESREISIRGAVIVKDLAAKLNIKPNRLIADLMALKILASINQRVEPDVATKIAEK